MPDLARGRYISRGITNFYRNHSEAETQNGRGVVSASAAIPSLPTTFGTPVKGDVATFTAHAPRREAAALSTLLSYTLLKGNVTSQLSDKGVASGMSVLAPDGAVRSGDRATNCRPCFVPCLT